MPASSACCWKSVLDGASVAERETSTSRWPSLADTERFAASHATARVELSCAHEHGGTVACRQGAVRGAGADRGAQRRRRPGGDRARGRDRGPRVAGRPARPRGAGRGGARAGPRQPGTVLHDHAVRRVRDRLSLLLRSGADRPHATPRSRAGRAVGKLRRRPRESARRPGARARGRTPLADQVLSDTQRSLPGGRIAVRGDTLVSGGDPRGSCRAPSSC